MNLRLLTNHKGLIFAANLSVIWLAFLSLHYLDVGRNASVHPPSSDFHKFYLSAQRVDAGLSMYWMVPPRLKKGDPCHPDTPEVAASLKLDYTPGRLNLGGELPCLGPNLNPPVFTAMLMPLSRLPYGQAWWIWSIFSIICTAVFAILLAREMGKTPLIRLLYTPIVCALVFTFYPTLANFSLGQVGTPIALLLLASYLYAKQYKDIHAGLFLGLVLAVKPIFGLLWLGVLLVRRWRFAASSAVFAIFLSALGAAIFGLQAYQDYKQVAGNVHWTAANWNASWFGLFDRAYSGQAHSDWPSDRPLSKALGAILALTTLAISAWVLHRNHQAQPTQGVGTLFALGLPTTMLASPLGWMYYFPTFLISLSILMEWSHEKGVAKHHQLILILTGLLATIPVNLKPSPSPGNPTDWISMDSWYWLCALTAWLSAVMMSAARNAKRGA